MNILITEEEKNRILSLYEQVLKIQKIGKNVSINGQEYKLQVLKFGDWIDVSIVNLEPNSQGGYNIKAKLGFFSKSDVVPPDTLNTIKDNLGKDEILLGGKTEKKLVKL